MMNFAFKGTDCESLAPYLEGPSAMAVSTTDATAPARILCKFAKDAPKLEVKGGVVEGIAYDAAGIENIAKIPSRGRTALQITWKYAVTCCKLCTSNKPDCGKRRRRRM